MPETVQVIVPTLSDVLEKFEEISKSRIFTDELGNTVCAVSQDDMIIEIRANDSN